MNKLSLIPYTCGAGASRAGAEYGPIYCYDHDFSGALCRMGLNAEWSLSPHDLWAMPQGKAAHDGQGPRGSKERLEIVRWHIQTLADRVKNEISQGNRVLTIGGDHTMSAGSHAAGSLALGPEAKIGLICVDAHPDIQTYQSSISKALHGMHMATLTGLDQTLRIKNCTYPVFKPEAILFAGLRSIDPEEIDNVKPLGMTLMPLEELRRLGVQKTLRAEISRLKEICTHILLTIDLDGFSDSLAPSVGSPVPGGFLSEEIVPLLREVIDSHPVPLIEIVEFNPTLPGAEETYAFMQQLCRELLAPR